MAGIPDASLLASKRVVYIGGLPDEATPILVRAAMIPFGNILSVDMPLDYTTGAHRGFCFCEYEDADDAGEAIFNLDGSELLGRTIKVSLAQPNQINKLSNQSEAIWKSDEWFQQHVAGRSEKEQLELVESELDAKVLQET